jgi:hypothetical protein
MRSSLLAAALLAMTAPSWAADIRTPDPALSPAEVVEIQLRALQANDTPEADAGIAQTWAFAHPDNKRVTGPLPRFAQMIKGPLYQILLGHRSHEIKEVSRSDSEAVFAVTVTSQTGEVVGYRWSVREGRRWRGRGRLDDDRGVAADRDLPSHSADRESDELSRVAPVSSLGSPGFARSWSPLPLQNASLAAGAKATSRKSTIAT